MKTFSTIREVKIAFNFILGGEKLTRNICGNCTQESENMRGSVTRAEVLYGGRNLYV